MIVQNGTLQQQYISGGGMTEDGMPISVDSQWGEPTPCNIVYNQSDRKGTYIDGNFKRTAATILIEPQDFTAKRVKIRDNRGIDVGEFEVQDVQYLQFVDALQIKIG